MPYYFYGTNYSESLFGTSFDDVIVGYGGHDYLAGGAGNDDLYGGSGDDDLVGGTGYNDLWGGAGYDWFVMSARGSAGFSDDLINDFEFDRDRIDVSAWGVSDLGQIRALLRTDPAGSATLNAFYAGYNHVITVDGVAPNELITKDFVFSNSGAKTVYGTSYADVLFGSRFSDTIYGNAGNDKILGGLGNDRLNAGYGNDQVFGGLGADAMVGGPNADSFVFQTPADSAVGIARDRIDDFQQNLDRIDLSLIDARPDLAGNQAFVFQDVFNFTNAGQVRYAYAGGQTIVSGNTDFDATPEFEIALTGIYDLRAADFYL